MSGTCEYYDGSDHPACPALVAAHVEPKPVGGFVPVALCVEHVFPHIRNLANLGDDWSVAAVSVDAARALSLVGGDA